MVSETTSPMRSSGSDIAAMLSKLGGRGYRIHEERATYGGIDIDPDSDFDPDVTKFQLDSGGNA